MQNHPTDRERVWSLLGGVAVRRAFGPPRRLAREVCDGFTFETLAFPGVAEDEDVPAYLVTPPDAPVTAPAVLYCHAHGARYDIGKEELLEGRPALTTPYAGPLAAMGFVVLCLEMPCFGARAGRQELATAKAHFWRGTTLFGQMLGEQVAGLDYLAGLPGVDAGRIGAIGVSMGGTLAWWLSALDDRVRAAVSLCCLADLACLIEADAHDGHGQYMTVPGLLARYSTGRLAGLAAPRAQLHGVGLRDWSTPQRCFETARAELTAAYVARGAASQLAFVVEPDAGHEETPDMRRRTLDFLALHLAKPAVGGAEGLS